jgi:DNA-binding NtrC family response regulator
MKSKELLIFVGYSSDARDEALAIKELKPLLQENLKRLNHVAERSNYSDVEMFDWESDAAVGVGGQGFAITPYIQRAVIAIFVFKHRIGPVTWQELESFRSRRIEERIPIFTLFCDKPPYEQMGNFECARAWTEVLERKLALTAEWSNQDSRSITPLPHYRDKQDLQDIVRTRLTALFPTLLVPSTPSTDTEPLSDESPSNGNFLDTSSHASDYDPAAVSQYRSLLRADSAVLYPHELAPDDFLRKAGYLRERGLTIAGALLFNSTPSRLIPSAIVRCTVYEGTTKATARRWNNCQGPLLTQIVEARDFIAQNVRRREVPVETSMKSSTIYEYPMVCVREILANAVCHRDYEDKERLTYVTVYEDRLEIQSPGVWVSRDLEIGKPYSLSTLKGSSVQRNMRLAHSISSVGMMEGEGSGIPSAVVDCASCGAPDPVVELRDGYVCVTIYPRADWDLANAEPVVPAALKQEITPAPSRLQKQPQSQPRPPQKPVTLFDDRAAAVGAIVGQSPSLRRALEQLYTAASSNSTVVITGETGTGKELFARALHQLSGRRAGPYVMVNCGTLASELAPSTLFGHERGAFTGATSSRPGLFEKAHGGTIVLDEIGLLPLDIQAKLSGVLDTREILRLGSNRTLRVDVRVVATTNVDLRLSVEEGRLREDLLYRLNVLAVDVPALRDRLEDIPLLAEAFLTRFHSDHPALPARPLTLSSTSLELAQGYRWPGNVRELHNVLARASTLTTGPVIELHREDLLDAYFHPSIAEHQASSKVRRGEVIVAGVGSYSENMSAERGLYVVVQNDVGNQHSRLTIVLPITEVGTRKLYPVHVMLEPDEGGVSSESFVDCGQLYTIRQTRIRRVLGSVTQKTLENITQALKISLGF